jgi:hypothetical protein
MGSTQQICSGTCLLFVSVFSNGDRVTAAMVLVPALIYVYT